MLQLLAFFGLWLARHLFEKKQKTEHLFPDSPNLSFICIEPRHLFESGGIWLLTSFRFITMTMAAGLIVLIVLLCILPVIILPLIALIDILRCQFYGNDKLLWVIIVLLFPFFGSILYFIIGSRNKVNWCPVRTIADELNEDPEKNPDSFLQKKYFSPLMRKKLHWDVESTPSIIFYRWAYWAKK